MGGGLVKPLKVSQVNSYIKRLLSEDMILSDIQIEGEVSNYKKHYSGHLYFSLKDETGRIKCVMFKSYASRQNLDLVEGQKIIAKGYISIYEKGGDYQLYVREIVDQGIGDLFRRFEKMKAKLEGEGLFNEEFKKPIPTMPKKIGIVTSATGAAIRDIITVIKRRFPQCNLLIYPSLVQGAKAAENIIKGLIYLDKREDVDLIIVGRGGGSIEELFAFNDEELARTIFSLRTPIISAVGHETDFTIADFVADLRAATPSAAAEIAVPDAIQLTNSLRDRHKTLITIMEQKLSLKSTKLEHAQKLLKFNSPEFKINNNKQELDNLLKEIENRIKDRLRSSRERLLSLDKELQLLNPSLSLDKGHSIITDTDGMVIKSIKDLSKDESVKIILHDGSAEAVIRKISKGGPDNGYK